MPNLYETYVPPIGPKDAKIALVGESPGTEEVAAGRPFIGSAGRLLDDFLRAAGIDRDELYITNTVKYFPKGNKADYFFESGHPTKAYMDGIVELVQELNTLRPNVVVPLGNYALWALTQQSGITNWRGSILESTLLRGLKVIPTIHPAWYLRSFAWNRLPLGEWDFQRIKRQSEFPEIRRPKREFLIDPSASEIEEVIERFTRPELMERWITCDTEWYSPETLAYISFADSPNSAVCIPATSMMAYRAYQEILGSDIPKCWQNAAFDAVALARIGIEVRNIKHDTMVAWNCCWADLKEKGLKLIGSVLTEEPYYKEDLEFVGTDDEKGMIYCSTDSVVTDEAMEKMLTEELPYCRAEKGYEISMSIQPTFIEASKFGILIDRERLLEMKADYLRKAREREAKISEQIGWTINCRSPQQVCQLVYDEIGIKREKRTSAQDVLMDIAAALPEGETKELLTDIIWVRRDRNIVSRYINEGIIDKDGRARTNWNVAGTRSGRLSATKPWWNGVAQQTVPDDSRCLYIADPGHIFIGWDLAQAEARVVAVKTRDYDLLEDMKNGIDIHVKLAAALPFGLTYDEIMERCRVEGKDNVDERFLAKKTRHGMNYILTWHGLKRAINREYIDTRVGVNASLAKTLRQGYLDVSPGLEVWWHEVFEELRATGMLTNAFGRTRKFLGKFIKYEETHREAVSFYPQSTVADLTSISIRSSLPYFSNWGRFLLHAHDGGLVQVPEERKDEAIEIVKREMEREIRVDNEYLTIPCDVKFGKNWGEMEYV